VGHNPYNCSRCGERCSGHPSEQHLCPDEREEAATAEREDLLERIDRLEERIEELERREGANATDEDNNST
jgi:hypothetical protein